MAVAHRRPVSQSVRAEHKSYHKFVTHDAILNVGLVDEDFFIENVTTGGISRFTPEEVARLADTQYDYGVDGPDVIRWGNRGGKFVMDRELTELGFDGVQDVDWEYRGGIG